MAESMIQINIAPSDTALGDLIAGLEMVSTQKLPNTVHAIKMATAILEYTWKSYAMGAPIPGTSIRLHSVRGAYAKSIKRKSGRLSGAVWSDSPYAASIEEGTEALDLKKIIPLGPKSRMGKNGPYTIVPMRHGTPGALSAPMPQQVYSQILKLIAQKQFAKSTVSSNTYQTPNASGQMVTRNKVNWGTSFRGPKGAGGKPKFPDVEGMTVFNVPSGGRETRGQYVTFRVVSLNKPKQSKAQKGWEGSWVVPSRQGYHLTRYVVANTREIIAQVVRAGITMDLLP